jgi:hypothetical protein
MNQAFRVVIVALAFTGIFLAGAITGGVLTGRFIERRRAPFEAERRAEIERLQDQLGSLRQQQLAAERAQAMRAVAQAQARQQGRTGQRWLPSPEQFGPQLMQRFINQLHPTPAQREQIRPLVDQAAESLRRLRADTAHTTEVTLEHLEDQISAVLQPAQRDRFNELIARWREAFQRFNQEQQRRQAEQRLQEQRLFGQPGQPGPSTSPAGPDSGPGSAPPPPPPAAAPAPAGAN